MPDGSCTNQTAALMDENGSRQPGGEKAGTLNGTLAYNELYGIMIHLLCTLAEMTHRMK